MLCVCVVLRSTFYVRSFVPEAFPGGEGSGGVIRCRRVRVVARALVAARKLLYGVLLAVEYACKAVRVFSRRLVCFAGLAYLRPILQ